MKTFFKPILLLLVFLISNIIQAQIPIYNSHPAGQPVIYLDFDGHNLEGTIWNWDGPINCAPAGLSTAVMTEIFNRVSEDYRPFSINITTDSTVYHAAPINHRMRVILTPTWEWYGAAGGVAYINSFSWGDNTPAFVFTSLLHNNPKLIAEATSHEAGHTLGLRHQSSYDTSCVKTSEYNWGTGSGEIGWAPIMGASYNQNFTVWHLGPNPFGCTSTQNDLALITRSRNGVTFRVDDHSNDLATATEAVFVDRQLSIQGVISQTTDSDVFKFQLPANNRLVLNAIPYNIGTGNTGSNLDMQVELIDANENTLGIYNPGLELGAFVDTLLPEGTYYLKVDGSGNMYATEYGSLGSYRMEGVLIDMSVLTVRKFTLKGLNVGKAHKLNWEIDADETVKKQVLEVSENGRYFSIITEPSSITREYSYIPSSNSTLQYRLKVLFENGKQLYSNNILVKSNGATVKPQLNSTLIHSSAIIVTSPSKFDYIIYDFSGRMLSRGIIKEGSTKINTGVANSGTYIIHFSNSENTYVEKFVKQ
jgi:hypothetical protein